MVTRPLWSGRWPAASPDACSSVKCQRRKFITIEASCELSKFELLFVTSKSSRRNSGSFGMHLKCICAGHDLPLADMTVAIAQKRGE